MIAEPNEPSADTVYHDPSLHCARASHKDGDSTAVSRVKDVPSFIFCCTDRREKRLKPFVVFDDNKKNTPIKRNKEITNTRDQTIVLKDIIHDTKKRNSRVI